MADPRLPVIEKLIVDLGYQVQWIPRDTVLWHLNEAGSVEGAIQAMQLNKIPRPSGAQRTEQGADSLPFVRID